MSADFYGFNDFSDATAFGSVAGAIVGVFAVIYLLMLAYGVVVYVLDSLGMYTVAKRRGIHHPWLAWIPIANLWILGSVSDQYQYVAKGKVRNRRKVLLGLTIATYVLTFIVAFGAGFSTAMGATGASGDVIGPILLLVIGYLAVFAVAICLAVFQYIAYYDLFVSCNPDNAVVFLILSILFGFLLPFFVFACRKKDLGMPPRKQAPAEEQREPEEAAPELPQPVAEDEGFAEEGDFADNT